MKKKSDLYLILGIFLLAFGTISTGYAIVILIIRIIFMNKGIILYVKDVLFDLVFILLGLLILRKKNSKKAYYNRM
ncbi:MAG: hypothetical protein ACFFDG_14405 [Promethearchaeota archaeon]